MRTRSACSMLAFLAAAVSIASLPGEAEATYHRHHKHAAQNHVLNRQVRHAQAFVLAPAQGTSPGTMRYFGGPKSPMWRAPAE
jgi:hypothetical protein